MASVSIYLNFMGNAEEAFNTYKKVFKSEFSAPLMRMKDIPPSPGAPAVAEADKDKVMHVALPILGGTQIMATDMLASMGHVEGNVTAIALKTKVSGSGNVDLTGSAKRSTVRIFGSGQFSGLGLVTTDAAVHISGSGHAGVNASNQVDAALHGSAGLTYTGTANIHTRKSGSAGVSKL